MSLPIWIALGVVVLALGVLGALGFELLGHLSRVNRAVGQARANLAPKAKRLQPLLEVELRNPLPQRPPTREIFSSAERPALPALPQATPAVSQVPATVHAPKHSVELGRRRQEETT